MGSKEGGGGKMMSHAAPVHVTAGTRRTCEATETDLHGHEAHPGELDADTPLRLDAPQQHQAQNKEGHGHHAQPQLQQAQHTASGYADSQ